MGEGVELDRPPYLSRWWRNRRIMAYWAMVALSIVGYRALFGEIPPSNAELLQTLCWVFAFVVGAYFGGNAVVDFFSKGRP